MSNIRNSVCEDKKTLSYIINWKYESGRGKKNEQGNKTIQRENNRDI